MQEDSSDDGSAVQSEREDSSCCERDDNSQLVDSKAAVLKAVKDQLQKCKVDVSALEQALEQELQRRVREQSVVKQSVLEDIIEQSERCYYGHVSAREHVSRSALSNDASEKRHRHHAAIAAVRLLVPRLCAEHQLTRNSGSVSNNTNQRKTKAKSQLCEYEQQRAENIKRNERVLASLGLPSKCA